MDQLNPASNRVFGTDVMVSYSSQDRNQVMQFVQKLRAAGIAVWIDQGGIDGAQRWGEEIVNAIEACKTVILMISHTSMQSENIAKEVMLAWEGGKQFLPVCLDDAKIPKSMQYQLAGIQHLKLYEGDAEVKFIGVLRALVRLGVGVSPYYRALISADQGDRNQAFEWLNRACEQHSRTLAQLDKDPRFSALRGDPRFAEIVQRVASLTLEQDDATGDIPLRIMRAAPLRTLAPIQRTAPSGPVPWWKKLLWPEVYDDRSARYAAAQGVFAAALLALASIASLVLPGMGALLAGWGWNDPVFIAEIFIPVAIGIQKMGRPAAIAGLAVCLLIAIGSLSTVGILHAQVTSMHAAMGIYSQYPSQYQYQNPYQAQYDNLSSQYYYSWFAFAISAACVVAFTAATRGTLAYRHMVMAGQAPDKQDAIGSADWTAIKARFTLQGAGETAAPKPLAPAGPVAVTPASDPSMTAQSAAPSLAIGPSLIVASPVTPLAVPRPSHPPPGTSVVPARQTFAELIGVNGGSIVWLRVAAFLLANVAASLVYWMWRSLTSPTATGTRSWFFAIGEACLFSIAVVVAFRSTRNAWMASAAAAGVFSLAGLAMYSQLSTFAWSDLFYREQFQQFLVLPFITGMVFLVCLILAVPRVHPLALALGLSSLGAELGAHMATTFASNLGAGDAPDAILAGTTVLSALIMSATFALVFWGLLQAFGLNRATQPRAGDDFTL
jgi:hypothetical protein